MSPKRLALFWLVAQTSADLFYVLSFYGARCIYLWFNGGRHVGRLCFDNYVLQLFCELGYYNWV